MTFDRYCTAEANITYRTQVVWPSQVKTAIYPYETKRILKRDQRWKFFFYLFPWRALFQLMQLLLGTYRYCCTTPRQQIRGFFVCVWVCVLLSIIIMISSSCNLTMFLFSPSESTIVELCIRFGGCVLWPYYPSISSYHITLQYMQCRCIFRCISTISSWTCRCWIYCTWSKSVE